jgi:hypothetical protein
VVLAVALLYLAALILLVLAALGVSSRVVSLALLGAACALLAYALPALRAGL